MKQEKIIAIAYIPVLHQGYENFFFNAKSSGVKELCIISQDLIGLDYIKRKDALRALSTSIISASISAWNMFEKVSILDAQKIASFSADATHIIMPDEDISKDIAKKYFENHGITYSSIFLRWHKDNVEEKKLINPDRIISANRFVAEMMAVARKEAEKSSDWWRQVGCVAIKNGKILFGTHNQHTPDPQTPYIFGDPRAIFKKGVNIELSSADHAEAVLVGEAARRGVSLSRAHLVVTDFPCPPCARLIARAGIQKLYFQKGYSMLDGQERLKEKDIEIILVS